MEDEGSSTAASTQPMKVQKCPECGSDRLIRDYETAEIVCMDCGIVIAAKLQDRGPEWRALTMNRGPREPG